MHSPSSLVDKATKNMGNACTADSTESFSSSFDGLLDFYFSQRVVSKWRVYGMHCKSISFMQISDKIKDAKIIFVVGEYALDLKF